MFQKILNKDKASTLQTCKFCNELKQRGRKCVSCLKGFDSRIIALICVLFLSTLFATLLLVLTGTKSNSRSTSHVEIYNNTVLVMQESAQHSLKLIEREVQSERITLMQGFNLIQESIVRIDSLYKSGMEEMAIHLSENPSTQQKYDEYNEKLNSIYKAIITQMENYYQIMFRDM